MAGGRPTSYTKKVGDSICELLADGVSLRKACLQLGLHRKTVRTWRDTFPEFRDQYARAREEGMDVLADEILDIADDSSGDVEEVEDGDGDIRTFTNHERINRSRLRVDTRKWLMSKIYKRQYGDKQEIEHSGNLTVNVNLDPKPSDSD